MKKWKPSFDILISLKFWNEMDANLDFYTRWKYPSKAKIEKKKKKGLQLLHSKENVKDYSPVQKMMIANERLQEQFYVGNLIE